MNASYNVNLVVHNTSFVVGHFHLTVGTAVTLTFMGILYWLVPYLSGRALVGRRWALAQAWLWFIGMGALLARAPSPRPAGHAPPLEHWRCPLPPLQPEWQSWLSLVGIGGVMMTLSGLIFFAILLLTLLRSRQPAQVAFPEAAALSGPADTPALLDRWRPWLVLAAVLIVVAYGPPLATQFATLALTTPGLRPW
ncbi:MAG: hypothetical protein KatS3mg061_3243 [Dehalococcoidia bacterium]|nr:MAG: hypothetical protein KatS3mg061_3243 [Dehalococcoidia bacterium]